MQAHRGGGLRYGPVSWNSKAGSVIDLLVELDAHGVIGCVRPVGTPLSTRPVKNISGVPLMTGVEMSRRVVFVLPYFTDINAADRRA